MLLNRFHVSISSCASKIPITPKGLFRSVPYDKNREMIVEECEKLGSPQAIGALD